MWKKTKEKKATIPPREMVKEFTTEEWIEQYKAKDYDFCLWWHRLDDMGKFRLRMALLDMRHDAVMCGISLACQERRELMRKMK